MMTGKTLRTVALLKEASRTLADIAEKYVSDAPTVEKTASDSASYYIDLNDVRRKAGL